MCLFYREDRSRRPLGSNKCQTEATKSLQIPLPESGPTSRSPLAGVGRGGAAPFDGDIIAWVGGVFTALLEPDEAPKAEG